MLFTIIVGFALIGVTIVIQGYGTLFWMKRFTRYSNDHSKSTFRKNRLRLIISSAFFLIFIHLIQTSLWALVYLWLPGITEFKTFEEAIYFSMVTFTTLGYGEITIASAERVLAGLEAMNGIILIGWSTAFMFAIFAELIKKSLNDKSIEK